MEWWLLDKFFMVFHTALILFNVFGWIWMRTRAWNLATLVLTGLSWTLLGIWYGWGYCPCTDWHFDVLRKLGYTGLPSSYIKFLIDRLFGTDINADLVNDATLYIFLLVLVISVGLNVRDYREKRHSKNK